MKTRENDLPGHCPALPRPQQRPHLPPCVQHTGVSAKKPCLTPAASAPLANREVPNFAPSWPNPGPEASQKIHELSNHLPRHHSGSCHPYKMPTGKAEAAVGSAESPLHVQTAQQLSDVPITWASPCASTFQKKKRKVTSGNIYSPTQHDGRCRKMLV